MTLSRLATVTLALTMFIAACGSDGDADRELPQDIAGVLEQPRYRDALWSLRVVDLDTGELLLERDRGAPMMIASVRKLFSVGLALDTLGEEHRFTTPIHRVGTVDGSGVLDGNLVLVASGDLAMGGRTNPDGSYAIGNLDHNEANELGNADLTAPDPLAGYEQLARGVAAAGITRIEGDVVIDDRLFEPFDFREQFDLSAIFVNDNVVDVTIDTDAAVDWRPKSSAFAVQGSVQLGAADSELDLDFEPLPDCLGEAGCIAELTGTLPRGFEPPLTGGAYPLVRTFRINEPAVYARTVLIEALARAGVTVAAPAVGPNNAALLPADRAYPAATRLTQLVSHPYKDYARHVMKVSYNIGADTSLMLLGGALGERTLAGALGAERDVLVSRVGIPADRMDFIDGSGGGDTTATAEAVTDLLLWMNRRGVAEAFREAQPRLGVDGSLAFVTDFEADPSLAGAKGQVYAKTGTYVSQNAQGRAIHSAQALAGYITAKSGRRLAFALIANDIGPIQAVEEVLPVFQDEGKVAAMIWKAY